VDRNFSEVAQDKGLALNVELAPNLPPAISTDNQRLQQVLRNLLSNALKFTEEGQVTLRMEPALSGWGRDNASLNRAERVIAFVVSDTGIGIPAHRHRMIFEAFQQGDGTTSRKYGGTGLGLSISREIAGLLGGEIRLTSAPGEGSTFTLYLPQRLEVAPRRPSVSREAVVPSRSRVPEAGRVAVAATSAPTQFAPEWNGGNQTSESTLPLPGDLGDDRSDIKPDDLVLLIVEDDPTFARILLDRARERGFKGVVATRGDIVPGAARQYRPDAITLDLGLPDTDGWAVLDRLKHDPATSHIPVHIISGLDDRQRGLRQGAIAYLHKPVTREALDEAFTGIRGFVERKVRRLLVVEDDEVQRNSIVELIGNGDVQTTAVRSGDQALAALASERYDCMVLDLGLPDMSGFELIERIRKQSNLTALPIVIYTGRELTKRQETELRRVADSIIVKDVRSLDRLLDETTLFLHRVQANLPQPAKQLLEQVRLADPVLTDKKVLIVDDDVRNIFALTSLLEQHQMQVHYAENGRDAIALLQEMADIDVVLMDVMMPEMDGYETTRAEPRFASLPIIALTAKAMKGDREQCIQAGASDYIAKPVDTEQLLSLLRVWLYR
jgi:CheY-like chemotaxis protein